MVEAWSTRAGLYAIFAAAALFTAGCSHVATVPKNDGRRTAATKTDRDGRARSGDHEARRSRDRHLRPGTDRRSHRDTRCADRVAPAAGQRHRRHGAPLPAAGDLFERMRTGFVLDDVEHAAVEREVRWFASHPDYLDRTFKRGERYLYHIVNEIEAREMPLELALLPVVESAFNPVAYSRARASGLWQFIPGTGRRYGLKQNWYYDGRRDVVAATSRRTRLSAVPLRRVRRRLAAGGRRLQLRRSERRPRGQKESRGRQADGLLQPEAAARDARLRAEAAGDAPHRRATRPATAWRSRRSRISPISPRSMSAGRSICTSPPSWPSCRRKRCSR